jgi:hypothetical protein
MGGCRRQFRAYRMAHAASHKLTAALAAYSMTMLDPLPPSSGALPHP